jgi:hypothetical protein
MKNQQIFLNEKFNRVELHLLRSYLRAKKMRNVVEVDPNKVWDNYMRLRKLIDDGKK